MLSSRGHAAVSQPLRADLDLFFEAQDNQYHPTDNPEGKFLLCIAENGLCWPEMEARLREIAAGPIPDWVPRYTAIGGAPELRAAAAGFLERAVAGVPLNPERLHCAAGAAAVIEMTSFLLGDPGDVVVIPGPAYMAYTPDIGNIPGLERYDLHPSAAGNNGPGTEYPLSIEDLDRAREDLGDQFRVLLLTQPNNPTGQIFAPGRLAQLADWCVAHRVHLVVNEIYALSLIDQEHPDLAADYPTPTAFESFLPLLEARRSPYLHWWYAISKDFGLSGLRLGLAYSHNENLLKAWANYGAGHMVSNHTQWMLAEIFADHTWTSDYVAANQRRLTESYAIVVRTLRTHNVNYSPAAGSLFVWIDLSHLLTTDTQDAELQLWQAIYDDTGILLTSPLGMGGRNRGWVRLVYSCVSQDELTVAMQRFGRWLGSR